MREGTGGDVARAWAWSRARSPSSRAIPPSPACPAPPRPPPRPAPPRPAPRPAPPPLPRVRRQPLRAGRRSRRERWEGAGGGGTSDRLFLNAFHIFNDLSCGVDTLRPFIFHSTMSGIFVTLNNEFTSDITKKQSAQLTMVKVTPLQHCSHFVLSIVFGVT